MPKKKSKKPKEKKETEQEILNRIEAEKIVYEKAKKAEEAVEAREENEKPTKEMIQKESKLLRNLLLVLGLIAIVVAFILILNNTAKNFSIDGVSYTAVQSSSGHALTLYNTKVLVTSNGSIAPYNFYLYNDPRVLQKQIPFNGSIRVVPGIVTVLNITGDLTCNGDGVVGIVNLQNLYNLIGKVIKDPNATCDFASRYLFINIQESNQTSIQQIAPMCYNINVNNCQILAATERYMTETFTAIHNISSSK